MTKLPGGTTERAGGMTKRPGGTTERAGGMTKRLRGTTERAGGMTKRPGGTTERGEGLIERSEGTVKRPKDGFVNNFMAYQTSERLKRKPKTISPAEAQKRGGTDIDYPE